MKKLLKSALAFALCLALVAAIVPASVSASIPPERIPGKIYPGCFLIKLNEPFYGTEAEFVAMFPEVEFWNRDMWGWGRQVYTLQPGTTAFLSSGDEITVTEADFGKIFEITLEKDTSNAVREAIAALEGNPLVDYTETLDYFNHNQIEVCFYEPYEGDITELFSFMKIKSATEGTSAMRQIAAEQGREVKDFIKAKINKEFIIYLADRSSDAIFDALKNLNGCELVKSVFVQYYDDDSYRPCDIRNQNDCEGVIIPPEEDEATATALAVEAEPKTGDIVPGQLLIKLKDSYFGDLAELFPEIDIESYEDLCDIVHHKPIGDDEQKYLGKSFCITLTEKTVEAVEEAVAFLNGREEVEYAEPNIYLGACDEVPPVATPTITDALAVLRIAAGLAPATPEAIALYDKDGDGKVTVNDALMVLRIAAGLA